MITLRQFIAGLDTIPVTTSWYLSDISEAKGRQKLYKRQLPQRLKSLKEHALIESAVSSNRIGTIIFGKSLPHDRFILKRSRTNDQMVQAARSVNKSRLRHD